MNSVFVVLCSSDYEGSRIEGVYATKVTAEQVQSHLTESNVLIATGFQWLRYVVEEWPIEDVIDE